MTTSRIPNLRKLRTERLLTQAQLGAAIGISPRTLIRWEAGDGEPAASDLLALARFFSISIDQLVADLMPAEAARSSLRVSELSGPQLDYWVAKVQGMPVELTDAGPVLYEPGYGQRKVPAYSFDLSLANSLMQIKGMQLHTLKAGSSFDGVKKQVDGWVARCIEEPIACWGTTIPEAATRAYLCSAVGTELVS
ncbi:helix-turn-helix transcriptional regulator [Variovorax sp. J22G73]|uniref:helix-turn-helix transcriptional regulator n=1 Tax=unclassified Variovorax TaxID=663243 RepID=UPI0025767491|nr:MULTISPECIES: helix-turn-helix transcriptional regulator [unclassified Variovorax]MDM0007208.1 helix-turn-helix transcriptional regulator [Variovorax sp. J22R203]MDM0099040.1 helix-turn-helix transcriptional regulator [Variovorax sp. J22G73]